jgi:hypothetical protein
VTLMLLAGHGPWSGHTLVALSGSHGLNSGDLVPLAAWLAGAACCAYIWRGTG